MTAAELAERRKALGLTRNALAVKLGVAASTVKRWEESDRAIPPYLDLALRALQQEQGR